MKICSNCKTADTSVQARALGTTVITPDPRESSRARSVDFCNSCWSRLICDDLEQFVARYRPIPDAYKG